MRKGNVAFANFICTFGDAGGLVDNWDVVLPAFLTDTLVRKYGANFFHFYHTKLVKLGDSGNKPILALTGHFVKNVNLTREQTFDNSGNLIKSAASMPSSPSAFFVLILNTHRLVYYAETAHAPDLKSFEATCANFIKKVRENKIHKEYEDSGKTITKKALQERLPRPTVNVVPLSERERIVDFIDRFKSIENVRFRLIKPNHESDASEVVNAVRGRFNKLNPDHLDIVVSNSSGLDRTEVKQAVEEATDTGNTDIDIKGEDADGVRLKGSNDEFALNVELDHPASDDEGLRSQLFEIYKKLLSAGKIKIGSSMEDVAAKISAIASLL